MHNKNKMKVSELKEIIRKTIKDVVDESTMPTTIDYKDKNKGDKVLDIDTADTATLNKLKADTTIASVTAGNKKIKEGEIDELANVSVRYELAPDTNASSFTGKKNRIITAMQATEEPMSKIDVAGELGYNKQNPINADFMELVASGAIVASGAQAAPRLNRPAAEPSAAGETPVDSEFDFIRGDMTDDEIDASFAKAAAAGDEEPEIGDIEKSGSSTAPRLSDDEYEAFMKSIDLERRLAATKSNILKLRKGKTAAGDINDRPSTELQRLRDLKVSLEKRLEDLYASSAYLSQRQEKTTRKKVTPPTPVEPEEIEDEEPIDEWAVGRAQYYAGIKK
jgi:hypothetical protein